MSRYVVRPKAELDLDDRAYYYATEANPERGHRFLVAAHDTFALLATQPEMGWHFRIRYPGLEALRVFRGDRLRENSDPLPSAPGRRRHTASGPRLEESSDASQARGRQVKRQHLSQEQSDTAVRVARINALAERAQRWAACSSRFGWDQSQT